MFLPLNVVQSNFFCPKYMINNDVISPNTQKSLLIPIIAVVVFMAPYFYRNYIILFYDGYSKYSVNVGIFLGIFEAFFYLAGFLINTVVAVTQTKKNIALVLTIQKLHITFEENLKVYALSNWISVITLFVYYLMYMFYGYLHHDINSSYVAYTLIFQMSYDMNSLYAILLLKFLKKKVVLWNQAVSSLHEFPDEDICRILFRCYEQILNCYKLFRDTFQVLVSNRLT